MKRREIDHAKAIKLRLKGWSYSQIKELLKVSKSTLSGWLSDYPLTEHRIDQLQGNNPRRIERFRETMRKKRNLKQNEAYLRVEKDIENFSDREFLIGGFFLYWGEGLKSSPGTVMISNTDPAVLRYFVRWIRKLNIKEDKMHVLLHLYQDMNLTKEIKYWSSELNLPTKLFHKPYIKESNLKDITYKNGFGHGTCHVRVYSRELYDYVMMGLKYIREKYAVV